MTHEESIYTFRRSYSNSSAKMGSTVWRKRFRS